MKEQRLMIESKHFFASSDFHLFHERILEYDKRPFKDLGHMHQTLQNNFSTLTEADHLFFLGDLAFTKNTDEVIQWLSALQCKIYWIKGNHDYLLIKDKKLTNKFVWIKNLEEIYVNTPDGKQLITLCHYAMKVWNKSHRGSWQLFGHSHHSLKDDVNSLSLDVGCNGWGYKPVSFNDIKQKMNLKEWKSIDHH